MSTGHPESAKSRLVADIGGTHARFAIAEGGQLRHLEVFTCADFPGLEAVAARYLSGLPEPWPRSAAIAVATAVDGDQVCLTNRDWSFSIREVREHMKLDRLEVLNDFTALALALPHLDDGAASLLKPGATGGRGQAGAPIALIGPGTGLGVSGLVPLPTGGWVPLATEGGHRDLAATTEREWQVIQRIAARHGRTSAERVLSGPGLVELYRALVELEKSGGPAAVDLDLRAEQVVAAAGDDPLAAEALELFAAWLGAVAGDLALTLGAQGGVFLGGGMIPRMGERFSFTLFLERFLAKGRFRDYVDQIPVRLVRHPTPALVGLARRGF